MRKCIKLITISLITLLISQPYINIVLSEEYHESESINKVEAAVEDVESSNISQETIEETRNELTDYQKAVNYIQNNNLLSNVKETILNQGLMTDEELNLIPNKVVLDILTDYVLNYGTETDIHVIVSYLESYLLGNFNNLSYEDRKASAEKKISEGNLLVSGPEIMIEEGLISQEELDRLPDDAFYHVFIEQFTTFPTGGDMSTTLVILKNLYPQAFLEAIDSGGPEENVENNKLETESDGQLIPYNQSVIAGDLEYLIKRIFVLRPNEVGNQSSDQYMFGIEYSYENKSDETQKDYHENWLIHTNVTQSNDQGAQNLKLGEYLWDYQENQQENQAQSSDPNTVKEVKVGEILNRRVYYMMENIEGNINLSVMGNNSTINFEIDTETLLKLPPQSGLYYNETNPLVAYIFDFDKLYLAFSEDATLAEIRHVAGETELVQPSALSSEAQFQYDLLMGLLEDPELQLLELDQVVYEHSDIMVAVRQVEELENGEEGLSNILMTFKGDNQRLEMTNEIGDIYKFLDLGQ